MNLDPDLPWDELFRRCMQSWRDSAPRNASARGEVGVCERCADDRYLVTAQAQGWPHWQQHSLTDVLIDLRYTLLDAYLQTELGDDTLGQLINGSGLLPQSLLAPVIGQALELVDDYTQFVDLWIRDSLTHLGNWPARVLASANR